MKCRPNSILLLTQSCVSKFESHRPSRPDPTRPAGRVKDRATLWVIKPTFDWPIKSRFYHPVSYNVPDMTYNVFGGTLNLAQSIYNVLLFIRHLSGFWILMRLFPFAY